MKLLCVDSNMCACPVCRHASFIVFTSEYNIYLTDYDGEIADTKEIEYNANGLCTNCGARYKMLRTINGFIPLTTLRKILFKNIIPDTILPDYEDCIALENPMQKG